MANNKGRGQKAAKKNYYSSYSYEKNRKRKLERLLKQQPENEQIKKALKNIHHRGPKPSKENLGWVDRTETLAGFHSQKKNESDALYSDLGGPKDARDRAKMAAHVRKVERMRQHELTYTPKKERAKGTARQH